MMTGTAKPSREAVVTLKTRGSQGLEIELEAVLDTGFTESLTLPQAHVQALALPYLGTERLFLADGSPLSVDLHEANVVWDGQDRMVVVHRVEGKPLIGMALIWNHLLTMEAVDSGPLTLDPIP